MRQPDFLVGVVPGPGPGQVISQRIRKNDSVTFMKFLAMLDQHTAPGLRIRLIMHNGSSHTSRATRAWIKAHPRFDVTYTPKHASWLNIIPVNRPSAHDTPGLSDVPAAGS